MRMRGFVHADDMSTAILRSFGCTSTAIRSAQDNRPATTADTGARTGLWIATSRMKDSNASDPRPTRSDPMVTTQRIPVLVESGAACSGKVVAPPSRPSRSAKRRNPSPIFASHRDR
jgi:hypothetical protein